MVLGGTGYFPKVYHGVEACPCFSFGGFLPLCI